MNPLFAALSALTAEISTIRNGFFDRGWLERVRVTKPVISLGNLTVGGTGKTPVADYCLRLLTERGHKPALVCRSYRGSLRVPRRVLPSDHPGHVGDEALWFARRHPRVPVWSGPSKSDSALAAAKHEHDIDVILVDDGFQHRRLRRDLDLVLMDATDPATAYRTLPAGRGRETLAGLSRADAVLWTKVNWAKTDDRPPVPARLPAFSFEFHLRSEETSPRILLASAIARPESFHRQARLLMPEVDFREVVFRDHHPYEPADVERLLREAREFDAGLVLVTEKDEVKLRPLWPTTDLPLHAAQLEAELVGSVESFYEFLARALS